MTRKKDFGLFRVLSNSDLPLSEAMVAQDESHSVLDSETLDISRIIHSIMEELAAFNDYNMRMDATKDEKLREILEHKDRKSTRLNSSHQIISYAVFCLKKKTIQYMN